MDEISLKGHVVRRRELYLVDVQTGEQRRLTTWGMRVGIRHGAMGDQIRFNEEGYAAYSA